MPKANPCHHVMAIALTLLLCSSALWTDAAPAADSGSGGKGQLLQKALEGVSALIGLNQGEGDSYQQAIDVVADNINKATEKSEALIAKHMSAVDKDPGALITKNAMQNMLQGGAFLPHKSGTRSIVLESDQGYNGVSNYQPASWKITESMSNDIEKKREEPSAEKQSVVTYPNGLGLMLINGCATMAYSNTSMCYNSMQVDDKSNVCTDMIDAANYMGVGFDGRGYYRSESRKASLIQRFCSKKASFLGKSVPDTMNVLGIFDTLAETKSFQSVDEYMKYIRHKAGLSDQKNLFTSEASKFGKARSYGANLGAIGAIYGGALGAAVGGPVGAAMGATLGGAIGGSISAGHGKGSGSSSSTDNGQSSSKTEQTGQSESQQGTNQNFFAMMFVNIILYEITLDEVEPTDISFAALSDYMSLPVSYLFAGADIRYQNFLLRWGTHYIRSAKFGGQLKITKTSKMNKFSSQQEFASFAETEFQSMFATLQSKYSQQSSSWGFLGIGGEHKKSSQSDSAKSEASNNARTKSENRQSQNHRQSEFTQTTVEAQGGISEIAEALVDFYTPAFKQLFHEWLGSIKDYPKPFEFQLKPIDDLFNINMESLFPAGPMNFGCVGQGSENYKILVDPSTKTRYYIDTHTSFENGVAVEKEVRVDCKYSSLDEFKDDLHKRIISLEKAAAVYMAEGPIPTSSFDLQGGQPGCEEATIAKLYVTKSNPKPLFFEELLRKPFLIEFDMPEDVPNVITMQAKYKMIHKMNRWFAIEPNNHLMHLFDGCQIANVRATDTKVCFRNIILSYEESTGLFHIEKSDFEKSKQRIPTLPYWLAGSTVARSRKMAAGLDSTNSVPCNVKWTNAHRLDPSKTENCIHFTAASEGNLFVIFASVPRDHATWYYLQITPDGVSFYHAMLLQKSDRKKGIGMLGHLNLYRSFFVCVTQNSDNVLIQFGKADPNSEVGIVYSAYNYPADSDFSKLSFYSFGAGIKPVSLMDVRLTMQMPVMNCSGNEYVKKDGRCILVCHEECNGCRHPKDNTACHECKHLTVIEIDSEAAKVKTCVTQCPPGRYIDKSNNHCVPCSAGSFKAVNGNQECSYCPAGTTSPEGAIACDQCRGGTMALVAGSKKCDVCPAGTFAGLGYSNCHVCSAGYFSEAGQADCSFCSAGYYNDRSGMSSCKPCPAMMFQDKRGMAFCHRCPRGESSVPAATKCVYCPAGQILGSDSRCYRCPTGQYSRQGDTKCSHCGSSDYGYDGKACYLTKIAISDCDEPTGFASLNKLYFVCQNILKGNGRPYISNTDGHKEVTFTLDYPHFMRRIIFGYSWRDSPHVDDKNFVGIQVKAEGNNAYTGHYLAWICGTVTSVDTHKGFVSMDCNSGDFFVRKVSFSRDTGSYISLSFVTFLND